MRFTLLIIFIGLFHFHLCAIELYTDKKFTTVHFQSNYKIIPYKLTSFVNHTLLKKRPSPLLRRFHDKQKRNQKITAAVLAFPFPFGLVGLHRIYLGCPPYVPVVYIGTLGGVFGVLPLIDFFVIVIDKNTENYVNNQQVFMWVK
jgi:TM2 domain-containing membrane protein YozV